MASPPSSGSTHQPSPHDTTSISLIERVRRHEDDAWKRLVDLYAPLVFTWCRNWGMRADECPDLLQDVFSAVAQGITTFRREKSEDTFRGWLRVIAKNVVRQHLRKQARQPRAAGGTVAHQQLEQLDRPTPNEASSEKIEQQLLYQRALEMIQTEFEPATWQAFLACVMENRTAADIAEELGMTPGGVRQAKYRVLRKLRIEFGDLL